MQGSSSCPIKKAQGQNELKNTEKRLGHNDG